MRYGFVLPSGDATTALEVAVAAEAAGWDGFFMWEPVWGVDPWVALAAAAVQTDRIRLGTMVTPLSRRRPWKVAGETATLDRLSAGRAILAVGLGAVDTGFAEFGEVTDRRIRAELLDESLDIVTGLWRGQPFAYDGRHYTVRPTEFLPAPPPIQQPRIPIWVVAAWRRPKSLRRALAYDGVLPTVIEGGRHVAVRPEHVRDFAAEAIVQRGAPIDIIVEGTTGSDPKADIDLMAAWQDAGATWWLEAMWDAIDQPDTVRDRVHRGPPA